MKLSSLKAISPRQDVSILARMPIDPKDHPILSTSYTVLEKIIVSRYQNHRRMSYAAS